MLSRGVLAALLLTTFLTTYFVPETARAEPIGWMERFALAADRGAVLDELIPGTDDHYFYHCLHYQTVGELERAEAALADWLKEKQGRPTPLMQAMLDRQRLLTYETSPQRTIDYLVRRLGIQLRHAPPASQGERRYPSRLDARQLDPERLVTEALRRNESLKPLGIQLLAERFRQGRTAGIPIDLRQLLERIDGPYVRDLDELVIRELRNRPANERRFGDIAAHQQLTLAELRRVARTVPDIASDNAFVSAVLLRLRPDDDSDMSQQPDVRRAYLMRIEEEVRQLPPSYNSLKASAAFRLLEANLQQGVYDRDLLLRYLQLPRVSPIVRPELVRQPTPRASLNQDFMEMALLPPIGDERQVVRQHLEHFLRDAESPEAFAPYLRPDYLKQVFAETKLLAGIGPSQRWYRMLTPSQRQALRDAVELRLAADNRERYATDEPIELLVDVKNIDELVVRVYEINTRAYYRTHNQPIDTDLDLDGLVATWERTAEYAQPAEVRHRERLKFPELEGRGVWIVDLVGKGVRARALVRRGELHYVEATSADGMQFTIVDESQEPIPSATMTVGGREFVADDRGRVTLPPVADPTDRRAVISDGSIAEQVTFEHLVESYNLSAAMHLDRALLQSGGQAELLIRPRLRLGATPVAPKMLDNASVTIVATDLDGIETTRKVDSIEPSQTGELVVPMRVPNRLARLEVVLTGTVPRISDGERVTLRSSRSWDVAGIRKTLLTRDAFLTHDGDGFAIDVRGRSGEPVAAATVTVSLHPEVGGSPVTQTLQTDDAGRIELGALDGAVRIRYRVADGMEHERDLRLDRAAWPSEVHTTADREVRLPLPSAETNLAERYRLIELRDGAVHADRSESLSADNGLLIVGPLVAGDYQLIDRETGRRTGVVVVSGPVIDSVAVGRIRHRSIAYDRPLGFASVTRVDDGLRVVLSGDTRLARLHVYGSRYLGPAAPIEQLYLPPQALFGRGVQLPRCGYVSDLRLGDEYRYVLRRRYAAKYPGVMLAQPSLLLNPWETEETSNRSQQARKGQAPPPSAAQADVARELAEAAANEARPRQAGSDYDFLADPGVQLTNLRPDENGVITIPADAIAGLPLVRLVACDPTTVLQRTVTTSAGETQTVDLRLAKPLDAGRALTFERGVTVAGPEAPLELASLGSAQVQLYTSVGDLYRLYETLVDDQRFSDFQRLSVWHTLSREEKLAEYTRLASHEMHVFLRFHDQQFFDEVIAPYLANKKEKQFVDHWLLENNLSGYLGFWQYNQLNGAEKALLAMRVPEARRSILRELRERVDQQDDDPQLLRRIIDSALSREALDEMDADALDRVEEEEARFDGAFGGMGGGMMLGGDAYGEAEPGDRSRRARQEAAVPQLRESLRLGDGLMLNGRQLARGQAFFRRLDATKQWAESQWDRVRTVARTAPAELIPVDPFWAELAGADRSQLKVSEHLLRPIGNRHAALMALALCGLPLEPGQVDFPVGPDARFEPSHAVAVVTKRLSQLEQAEAAATVLAGQRFAAAAKRDSAAADEPAPELREFLTGKPYRGEIVVSNPTAQTRRVEVFWQIPGGSMPLEGSQFTDSETVELGPFAVKAIAYEFYFPQPGSFVHYPATVSADGRLLARGVEKTFEVVAEPSEVDEGSWEAIARQGSAEQIRTFLKDANLRDLDWGLIAHRMRDEAVFGAVTEVLAEARLPVAELWGYGFHHRDEYAMRAFLNLQNDLIGRVGPVLRSPLLEVDPVERGMIEHLEYAPLVRARIHRLGDEHEILNPTFLAQYRSFVRVLGFQPDVNPEQELALAYYLLLQNRIEEAIDRFSGVERESVATTLQYDYLDAYLAMHRGDFGQAESIAGRYAEIEIPRWRDRFGDLARQLRQRSELLQVQQLVSADPEGEPIPENAADLAVMDRERRQQEAAERQPEVIVRVEGNALRVDHRQTSSATIHFYGVDLELLFSKAPFVREGLQRMAMVRPTRSETVDFTSEAGVARYELDENLRRQTLLVEVVAGAARSTALFYGGEITTYVSEAFGQLQCTDARTHQPVRTAYVKVYARYPDGSVRFYKDGYTDARGRFDYASLSAADAQGAERFAILVLDEERGATLHDVIAPTR